MLTGLRYAGIYRHCRMLHKFCTLRVVVKHLWWVGEVLLPKTLHNIGDVDIQAFA
jgi:hypothetical protein